MNSTLGQTTPPAPLSEPSAYEMIKDNNSLHVLCASWTDISFLAVDTEFIRTSTFYPKVGLIQICDGQQNYLIDPIEIDEWQPLKTLMINSGIVKIFHSCSEDLLVFFAFLGVVPTPIFDTQLATAFLNEGFALSYQNMVKTRVNVEIPKGETRSDWLQRPLTLEQLKYAALDVAYLPQIYGWQTQQLAEKGMLNWVEEDCERLIQQHDSEVRKDFSSYYLSIKSAWQMDARSLAGLQRLASWREARARKRDKPRSWIIKDKPLLAIAKSFPGSKQELALIADISPNFIYYEGEEVLQLMQQVKDLAISELPEVLPRPLSSGQKNKFKKAQEFVDKQALTLSLPTEILGRKRSLMGLYHNVLKWNNAEHVKQIKPAKITIPDELQGWRKHILLDDLLEILQ